VLTGKNWAERMEDCYDEIWIEVQNHYATMKAGFKDEDEYIGACVKYTDSYHNAIMARRSQLKEKRLKSLEIRSPRSTATAMETGSPILPVGAASSSAAQRALSPTSLATTTILEDRDSDQDDWVFATPMQTPMGTQTEVGDRINPIPSGKPITFGPKPDNYKRKLPEGPLMSSLPFSQRLAVLTGPEVDVLHSWTQNRWMHLVAVMRYKRRSSAVMFIHKYSKQMPNRLDTGQPRGIGSHLGRWQWREVRHYW